MIEFHESTNGRPTTNMVESFLFYLLCLISRATLLIENINFSVRLLSLLTYFYET
jgi:hypothetical protein